MRNMSLVRFNPLAIPNLRIPPRVQISSQAYYEFVDHVALGLALATYGDVAVALASNVIHRKKRDVCLRKAIRAVHGDGLLPWGRVDAPICGPHLKESFVISY